MIQNDLQINVPQMQLPKGGGAIKGIGETFQPSAFTGTANFSIPIPVSPARGFEPQLSLSYSSGGSQGLFGMGFNLSIPSVSRRTEKRLPDYSEADEFVLSDAEYLVPALKQSGNQWKIDEFSRDKYTVRRFRTRTEGRFLRIERFIETATGKTHWEVTSPENIRNIYGKSESAQIAHPDNPLLIFQWLLEESRDARGNKIKYTYTGISQNDPGIPNNVSESGRAHHTQRYLHQIQYGNFFDQNNLEQWAFSIVFDYGEYNLDDPAGISTTPTGNWKKREDSFSNYRAGFEIRTHWLCRNILLFHHFEDELGAADTVVRALRLTYSESPVMSFLTGVRQVGYRRSDSGEYEEKAYPLLSFAFTDFDAAAQEYKPLTVDSQKPLPVPVEDNNYQLVDLYGEGIAGILFENQGTALYWRPEGDGNFSPPANPAAFPIENNSQEPFYQVTDGTSTWMVVRAGGRAGYYELNSETSWAPFKPFAKNATEFFHPNTEFTDVTGDGRPDVLLFEADRVKVYPSAGGDGHHPAITAIRPPDVPLQEAGSQEEQLEFADMCGDGLSDRVRIRSGSVEYWPNLGYGNFGTKVTMANAPGFPEGLNTNRLYLVDIDGSGTTDLIYFKSRHFEVYFNQGGNSFGDAVKIPLPAAYQNLSQIQFSDILGNGTACLVLTHGTSETRHHYYDFTGGSKPHLLLEADNHMGALTRLHYAPSTKFYLADKEAGNPWITRLPFPVNLVEKTEVIDQISKSRQVSCFIYHHGAYDGREREFAGFGMVERLDTEAYEQFAESAAGENSDINIPESELHVPPARHKTWYHTGVLAREENFSRQFEAEYYSGDEQALNLPDSDFESGSQNAASMVEAYRALRGQVLRTEIYADDKQDGLSEHPYRVTENAFRLRMIQPIGGNRYSVYLPLRRESLQYHYERNAADPRTLHTFYLEYDAFGNIARKSNIAYARRLQDEAHPDQARSQGTYFLQEFSHQADDVYRLNVLSQSRRFEVKLPSPDISGGYFSFDKINDTLLNSEDQAVSFDQPLGSNPARLIAWKRYFYWNDDQSAAAAPGEFGIPVLLHHVETAVQSEGGMQDIFQEAAGNSISDILVSKAGDGGAYLLKDGYYWDPGVTAFHQGADAFYRAARYIDQFDAETTVTFDQYHLLRTEIQDALGNRRTVVPDYQALKPLRIIDINNNSTEYRYDPLGAVAVMSRFGTEAGQPRGDEPISAYSEIPVAGLSDIISSPNQYLQQATRFFYYDLLAWERDQQPVYAVQLHRETYESDLPGNAETAVQISIEFTDGIGRNLQRKSLVEAGRALQVNADNTVSEVDAEERWLTSGRRVYNNKGQIIKQYQSFYSNSPLYQPEEAVAEFGVTVINYYDPLGRIYKTDQPKGYHTLREFSAWLRTEYDSNDTIKDSLYYQLNNGNLPDDAQDALNKAAVHHGTPVENYLDIWGRSFCKKDLLTADGDPLFIYSQLDISGHRRKLQDQRMAGSDVFNLEIDYDMAGRVLWQNGLDSGKRHILNNAGGDLIHRWDSRGFHQSLKYDALSRPVEIWMEGNGLNNMVEKIEYGEGVDPDGNNNLRGKIAVRFDQSGKIEFQEYDINGNWKKRERFLREDYKTEADWSGNEVLEAESFSDSQSINAAGRLTETVYPDGSAFQPGYHISGRLDTVKLQYGSGIPSGPTDFVDGIRYNARSQREEIVHGNSATTTYGYDEQTFELTSLKTVRASDNQMLQDIQYTYDPSGNITRIRDFSYQTVFNNNAQIDPLMDYEYDSLYRLTKASGREHPGLYSASNPSYLPDYQQFLTVQPNGNDGQSLQNYDRLFSYDNSGNLTRIQHIAGQNSFTRDIITSSASNRAMWLDGQAVNDPESFYDANGNVTEFPHLRAINWNSRNQLASVDIIQRSGNPNDSEFYVYDAGGVRRRKVLERLVNGNIVIEEKIYLDGYEIKRIRQGNSIQEERHTVRIEDDKDRIALVHYWTVKRNAGDPDLQIRYQFENHLGSASLEINDAGEIITYEEYYPYGGTALIAGRSQEEVDRKTYRYSNREKDDSTELYYYGARYYAPWLGRWITPDPAGTVDGLNLYAFVRGNPIRYIDDGGLKVNHLPRLNLDSLPEVISRTLRDSSLSEVVPSGLVADLITFFRGVSKASEELPDVGGSVFQARTRKGRFRTASEFSGSGDGGGDSDIGESAPSSSSFRSPGASERDEDQNAENDGSDSVRSIGVQGGDTITPGTDLNTTIIIAAAIVVAEQWRRQQQAKQDKEKAEELAKDSARQDLLKAIRAKKEIEERQNDEDIQNLNQAIREFDRSQLKKIDADEATEAVDDDQSSLLQEDGGGVAPPDDLTDDNDDVAEESQSTEEGSDDDDQPGNENEAANIQSSNSSFEGRKIQRRHTM